MHQHFFSFELGTNLLLGVREVKESALSSWLMLFTSSQWMLQMCRDAARSAKLSCNASRLLQ